MCVTLVSFDGVAGEMSEFVALVKSLDECDNKCSGDEVWRFSLGACASECMSRRCDEYGGW